jgi:L-threonylcarbamoyladenylate synthase
MIKTMTQSIQILDLNASESKKQLQKAGQIIKNGGLVVFPTETVYGLGADATDSEAAKKIYAAKGRPSDNPLIIHVSDPKEAEKYTYTNETYYKLASAFMPGPLTVILPVKDTIPKEVTAGLDTVALRCPSHPVALEFIKAAGTPIAAPSANLSGSPSPTCYKHVFQDMNGRVDMIIDGGECEIGLESTIVKIESDNTLVLLRPGAITVDELSVIAGEVVIADSVIGKLKDGERVLSPGMKYKHYAPNAQFFLLDGDKTQRFEYIKNVDGRVSILSYEEEIDFFSQIVPPDMILNIGKASDLSEQARNLFSLLRTADEKKAEKIFAPLPPTHGVGLALYNRMIRAAAHRIIKL